MVPGHRRGHDRWRARPRVLVAEKIRRPRTSSRPSTCASGGVESRPTSSSATPANRESTFLLRPPAYIFTSPPLWPSASQPILSSDDPDVVGWRHNQRRGIPSRGRRFSSTCLLKRCKHGRALGPLLRRLKSLRQTRTRRDRLPRTRRLGGECLRLAIGLARRPRGHLS